MKGQSSLEALFIIATFLLIISISIALLSVQKQHSQEFLSLEKAKTTSIECAMLVNAIFSNTAAIVSEKQINCTSEGKNRVKSTVDEKTKSSRIIALELSTNRVNGKDFLEVKMLEHYK